MRLLILSATTGGGHMAAANAIKEYVMMKDPSAVVKIIDALEYVSPFLNKAVTGGYVYMVRNLPKVYGSFYNSWDDLDTTAVNKTLGLTTHTVINRLLPLVNEFEPDIVVTTHAIGAEMITVLKNEGVIDIPVISIVTDFAIHQFYLLNDGVNAYIVSSREMVDQVVSRGVDRVKVYPYGIPVKQGFFKEIDRKATFESEGLDESIPTVLIMAGSFGVSDVLKIYHKIVKSTAEFQIIVITGKNEKLYETFNRYLRKITINNTLVEFREYAKATAKATKPQKPAAKSKPPAKPKPISKNLKPSKPTKLLYYTDEVDKYMHMADLIVTKPGGLTVTESIASNLPMAIFKAIPGQEEQNAEFLVSKNMAVQLKKDNTCTETITELLGNNGKLDEMKKSIKSFAKGNSAANLYILMLELIERYRNKQ